MGRRFNKQQRSFCYNFRMNLSSLPILSSALFLLHLILSLISNPSVSPLFLPYSNHVSTQAFEFIYLSLTALVDTALSPY